MLVFCFIAALLPVLPESGSGCFYEGSGLLSFSADDPDLCDGWPVNLNAPGGGFPYTPTVFDVDGDGADEVFFTGGHTFGLSGDGTFLPGWPVSEMVYMGYGTTDQLPGPSCADMTGEGAPAVLWSERDWYAGSAYMWSFNGRLPNGENLGAFPQHAPDEFSNALSSPFVLGDSDGDGCMEAWSAHTLGNTGDYYRISGFDHQGNRLFTRDLDPAEQIICLYFGDLHGDGQEIFIALTFMGGTVRLYGFDPEGCPLPGYPVSIFSTAGGLTFGPPVLWDVDGDQDLEILLGCNNGTSSSVQAVHHDGTPVDGFPVSVASQSQMLYFCLGDLNGDEIPELVALDNHLGSNYRVHALSLETGEPLSGWPVPVATWPHGSPAILDVDGDGLQDVVFVTEGGRLFALSGNGVSIDGYPKTMTAASISGVAGGDIDGDGLYELVAVTTNGWAYAWNTAGAAYGADWPMRGVDSRNTGVFRGAQGPHGVGETQPDGALFVLPAKNPVSGSVAFLVPGDIRGDLTLYDACGRRVAVVPVNNASDVVWNPGTSCPDGVYFAVLRSGSRSCTARIVLLR